jgi:hypothetical protein
VIDSVAAAGGPAEAAPLGVGAEAGAVDALDAGAAVPELEELHAASIATAPAALTPSNES